MLKIVNDDGLELPLPKDAVIPVEKNQPLFNGSNDLFQDVSYSINVPVTDISKLFFKRGDLIETNNDYYLQPGRFSIDGVRMETGNIRYRLGQTSFEANLEPNYASINTLAKNVRLTEILTTDAIYDLTDTNTFEALMLDSAQNPDKYPFIFFPVYNESWAPSDLPEPGRHDFSARPAVNFFDIDAGVFRARNTDAGDIYALSPYFKLAYVIQQVANYLGLSTAGSFFTDEEMRSLVVYTRCGYRETIVLPSTSYLPNITIEDFLKKVRDRLHLLMDFNLSTGILTIERFETVAATNPEDITRYISTTIEQEVPDQQSLTVTIKSDSQDAMFKVVDLQGNDTYPPLFKLVAGEGDTALELDCGTTKSVKTLGAVSGFKEYPIVNQSVLHETAWYPAKLPPDITFTDGSDITTLNNWPLRLMKYLGYRDIDGKNWPSATSYEFDSKDVAFYDFLNTSKRLIITAYMPAAVISRLKLTGHYGHKTQDGNFVSYLFEKIAYDAGSDSTRIPVKLYCRKFTYRSISQVALIPFAISEPMADVQYMSGSIKAYFDKSIHGISSLQVTLINADGSQTVPDPITVPANKRGTGGIAVPIVKTWDNVTATHEIRIKQGRPQYVIYLGNKIPFTNAGEYWTANVTNTYVNLGKTGPLSEVYTIFY